MVLHRPHVFWYTAYMRGRLLISYTLIAVLALALGYGAGASGYVASVFATAPGAPAGVNLAPVFEAWRILEEKFVPSSASTTRATDQDKVWGLVEGLAGSYDDPYTVFFPPDEQELFEDDLRGSFGGVGIELGKRDNLLTIIAPLKGTPGYEAGLQSGEIIIEINGVSTQGMSIDDAVRAIRGEIGTVVTLRVASKETRELREVPITRARIEVPTLETEQLEGGVFVIELYNFTGSAHTQFRTAMREFLKSGARALILDLRDNPGGYLESSVDIASWFLPLGAVVVEEDYGGKRDTLTHRSKGYNVLPKNTRLAVLINEGSASASEILAGALQDHGKATLIGETSFGKGSVQEVVPVTDDTSLKVTVARWFTPNGRSISEGGLTPTLVVPLTVVDREEDRDPQLDAALRFVRTGELVSPVATTTEAI